MYIAPKILHIFGFDEIKNVQGILIFRNKMHINFLLQPHNSCQNCYGKNVVLKFCDKCMPNLGKTAISFAHFLYGFCNFLYLQTNNKTNRNSRATATVAITN